MWRRRRRPIPRTPNFVVVASTRSPQPTTTKTNHKKKQKRDGKCTHGVLLVLCLYSCVRVVRIMTALGDHKHKHNTWNASRKTFFAITFRHSLLEAPARKGEYDESIKHYGSRNQTNHPKDNNTYSAFRLPPKIRLAEFLAEAEEESPRFPTLEEDGYYDDYELDTDDGFQRPSFSDDEYARYPQLNSDYAQKCRRTNWYRPTHGTVNCNTAHELDMSYGMIKSVYHAVGNGQFRQVYKVDLGATSNGGYSSSSSSIGETDNNRIVAFKDYLSFERGNDFRDSEFELVRIDALVSEKMSFSNRIVDIYGFCGITTISEFMSGGDLDSHVSTIEPDNRGQIQSLWELRNITKYPQAFNFAVTKLRERNERLEEEGEAKDVILDDLDDVDPKNNLSAETKLDIALTMAESVAMLHSFVDGVIVHGDLFFSQFLVTGSGRIKLNDFNMAQIMFWSERDQKYCRYGNVAPWESERPPEELMKKSIDEKVDVYSLGLMMYTVLTGLEPLYKYIYQEFFLAKLTKAVRTGEVPYIDPRWSHHSFAEARLVEIMKLCWTYQPEDRIDVFELVRLLRNAVEENKKKQFMESNHHKKHPQLA